ncbi:butyrophilin subfamily 1 member A1-like isoform X4 [Dermochelys coriacea]|uniref:butyrophilin subfamily 1 member A1-like isoform X4 n=1 Tax=Dermochelys coriacea TaxID=27794 RepID=UPI001CA89F61|nr:butyrophilin subfamily 1 member A1-like isoform X4 [Dermochelys coriacea]
MLHLPGKCPATISLPLGLLAHTPLLTFTATVSCEERGGLQVSQDRINYFFIYQNQPLVLHQKYTGSQSVSQSSAQFRVIGPDQPVTAIVGEDIVLPCHLSPRMSAENMEVIWFQSQLSQFVHRYSDGKDQTEDQTPEYQGRTVFLRDSIVNGNVSLRIHNIRPSDEGQYRCFVQSLTFYNEATLELKVADVFFPNVSLWIVAVCVILVVLFVCIGLIVYLFKMKEKLAAELRWRRVLTHSENLIVDPDTAHPQLILSEDWKRVRWRDTRQDLPNNPERFDSRACVLGLEGFTSGSHYWEVEVGAGRGWAVGVARASVKRKGWIKRNPEEGIWAVDYEWSGHYRALTSPRTCLPLSEVLRKLGIYLDYERGQVTVFDADKEAPIFTFPTASFNRERVFPLLWLWGTESELRLCP